MEASMAGLVPERRTRRELEQANAELIEKHKQHLQSWVRDKSSPTVVPATQIRPENQSDKPNTKG